MLFIIWFFSKLYQNSLLAENANYGTAETLHTYIIRKGKRLFQF